MPASEIAASTENTAKSRSREKVAPFDIGGETIEPGERRTVDLPVSLLPDHTPISMSVHVVHGRRPGPTAFVTAAMHGDEVNGVEVIRRLLRSSRLRRLRGTLLAIPIVNAYSFISHSRYLPDRRDLNRCFPGNTYGSLGSQLANLIMTEIVDRSDFGIDLHSGAVHRPNLPQARGDFSDPEVKELAQVFGTPVILNAATRDGSLRQAAHERGVPVVLYEASEALRFDEFSVRVGLRGITRVLEHKGMIAARRKSPTRKQVATEKKHRSVLAKGSRWVRSPVGGILRNHTPLGTQVTSGQQIGVVSDPFGYDDVPVLADVDGIVIGMSLLPAVNQGDALFHIALVGDHVDAAGTVEALQDALAPEDGDLELV